MASKKVIIEDKVGNRLYPHTLDSCVYTEDGESIGDKITVLSDKVNYKPNNWKGDTVEPSEYGIEKTIFLSTNSFLGYTNALVETTRLNAFVFKQVVSQHGQSVIKYRLGNGQTWGEVKQLATTEQIDALSKNAYERVSGTETTILEFVNNRTNEGYVDYMFTNKGAYPDSPIAEWGDIIVTRGSTMTLVECIVDWGGFPRIFKRRINRASGAWHEDKWFQDATTDKIDISPIPYRAGFVDISSLDVTKITKVNNMVTLIVCVKKNDNSQIGAWDILLDLPSGFRPNTNISSGNLLITSSGVAQNKTNCNTIAEAISYYV